MGLIYCLIDPNTNTPRYIGQTVQKLNRRYSSHISEINTRGKKTYVYNWVKSLKKTGVLPIIDIIDNVLNEELDFWETHYIFLYKSWGFKLTNGNFGGNSYLPTRETRIKLKNSSEKTKQRMLSNLNPSKNKSIAILQYNMDGNFIKEWESASVVEKKLGFDRGQIGISLNKTGKSCNGYMWRLKTTNFKIKINSFSPNVSYRSKFKKPIIQYDSNNTIIKEWSSVKEAQFAMNGKRCGSVSDVLTGRQSKAYGYKWIYKK